jgi:hypothetical protein
LLKVLRKVLALAADFAAFGLRTGAERGVIVFETCVQGGGNKGGPARFKRALIGIGESAPIRDK